VPREGYARDGKRRGSDIQVMLAGKCHCATR
jgi:hypothetical protein